MNNLLKDKKTTAIHPGEILREEYLQPLGLSAYGLAKYLHVPRTRIERLVNEKTPITLDTALRLAKFFHTSVEYWLNMQNIYDAGNISEQLQHEIATIREYEASYQHHNP